MVVGLGFMGFGFVSVVNRLKNLRIPLVITRRPGEAKVFLEKKGYKAVAEDNPARIKDLADKGYICVSDNLDLIKQYENEIVIEMTGTVAYGTEAALKILEAGKQLVTMNPELQATVGTELKKIADQKGLVITDVYGDQPGSLSRLIGNAKMMGFKPLIAGNMKRYLDKYATQEKMKPWADEKGLAVRQTTSFTDGTKQAIEMTLVGNYYGMDIIQDGMKGPEAEDVNEILNHFDFENLPKKGIVDYVIGKSLFPGIFIVGRHKDPNQQKYLKYLGLGEGPYYVLFEPYHLCHLEAVQTLAKIFFSKKETINNSTNPKLTTIALAKQDL